VTERLVFDAGALVALERNDRQMWARLRIAARDEIDVVVPTAVLAQVWRGTDRQARLARALKHTRSGSFDRIAREAGELCHAAGTADPIDASVALAAARTDCIIYTDDLPDIRRLIRCLPRSEGALVTVRRT
jgi:hypothetical protein